MDSSFLATIYIVAIAVFFLILVLLTITFIVSKARHADDDLMDDNDDDEDDDMSEFEDENEEVTRALVNNKLKKSYVQEAEEEEEDATEEEASVEEIPAINIGADSAFSDDEYVNTYDAPKAPAKEAVEDSAFTDSAFAQDSAFVEDSAFTDSAFSDSAFADSAFTEDSAFATAQPAEQAVAETVEEPVAEATEEAVEEVAEDSAFAEDAIEETEEETIPAEELEEEEIPEGVPMAGTGLETLDEEDEDEDGYEDSAFAPDLTDMQLYDLQLNASVQEAAAIGAAASSQTGEVFKSVRAKSQSVSPDDEFYWYNKADVAERPSYKKPEMYYHYFKTPRDTVEDLLVEMYDCGLVCTEEIRYIAYGIEPRAVSMKEILSSGNSYMNSQKHVKEPSTKDRIKIYEKWYSYVDKLFATVEIHADARTVDQIHKKLCEFGKSDIDVLIEGL